MAAYVLSDRQINEALTEAAERDVVIRLYLDKSHSPSTGLFGAGPSTLLAHPMFSRGSKARGF